MQYTVNTNDAGFSGAQSAKSVGIAVVGPDITAADFDETLIYVHTSVYSIVTCLTLLPSKRKRQI